MYETLGTDSAQFKLQGLKALNEQTLRTNSIFWPTIIIKHIISHQFYAAISSQSQGRIISLLVEKHDTIHDKYLSLYT